MKKFLFTLLLIPFCSFGQISYSVTVIKLKAKADDCDGAIFPFCSGTIQDPTFNIWCLDGAGNEGTNCWTFDDDASINYNIWKDILDVQIGSQSNVNTSYIQIDMAGFESDQAFTSCNSNLGDDEPIDRAMVQQFPLSSLNEGVVNTVQVSLNDVYFAELEIEWYDLYASQDELSLLSSFIVYPNPTNGVFKTSMNIEDSQEFSVQVLDMVGRKIYAQENMISSDEINLSGNEPGKYFIYLEVNGAILVESITLK